jgi:serine protease Do
MNRSTWCLPLVLLSLLPLTAAAQVSPAADPLAPALKDFYEKTRPALVAVKYQLQGELVKRELIGAGVVISEDGLVMFPLQVVSQTFPDPQMKDFKILIPSDTDDETEVDATFVGRDERADIAYVQAKGDRKWTAVHFEDRPIEVGQAVYGLGIAPKSAGYKAYLTTGIVSAELRGEIPQVAVSGGLGFVGTPVFDAEFHAIGVVPFQANAALWMDDPNAMDSMVVPPHFFVPSRFFLPSIADPPTAGHPLQLSWLGVTQWQGVNEQLATFLGLKNKPAIQLGDVVPDAPAARAGLEAGNIIVAIDGKPLVRGDQPEELPMILRRQLIWKKVGEKVTLTVLPSKGAATKDITVTMENRPRPASQAERFYASDLGFVAREAVFSDTYIHKLKADAVGVVVDLVKRDGAAATAKLTPQQWIMQLNGQPVTDLAHFKSDYEAFRKDHAHDPVVLVVHVPSGQEQTINIEPPRTDAAPGVD